MSDARPSFFVRIFLAWVAYFRTLFDADFAAGVVRLRRGDAFADQGSSPAPIAAASSSDGPESVVTQPAVLRETAADAALLLLGILQREGRFIDFLQEDVSGFSDEEIGAAARVVHEGCKKSLADLVALAPIRPESEGDRLTLERGFDAGRVRLSGDVKGEPPFVGTVQHRGWYAETAKLPRIAQGHDVRVLAPAEVEL